MDRVNQIPPPPLPSMLHIVLTKYGQSGMGHNLDQCTYPLSLELPNIATYAYPTPPCNLPPLAIPPTPKETVTSINIYCASLCCRSALHMALYCFPITSNQSPMCVL